MLKPTTKWLGLAWAHTWPALLLVLLYLPPEQQSCGHCAHPYARGEVECRYSPGWTLGNDVSVVTYRPAWGLPGVTVWSASGAPIVEQVACSATGVTLREGHGDGGRDIATLAWSDMSGLMVRPWYVDRAKPERRWKASLPLVPLLLVLSVWGFRRAHRMWQASRATPAPRRTNAPDEERGGRPSALRASLRFLGLAWAFTWPTLIAMVFYYPREPLTGERSCGRCRRPDGPGEIECRYVPGWTLGDSYSTVTYKTASWLPGAVVWESKGAPDVEDVVCTETLVTLRMIEWHRRHDVDLAWDEMHELMVRPWSVYRLEVSRNWPFEGVMPWEGLLLLWAYSRAYRLWQADRRRVYS